MTALLPRAGIVEALIANHEDVASVTVTEGQITAITMAESAKFKKYYFKRNTGQVHIHAQHFRGKRHQVCQHGHSAALLPYGNRQAH